MKLNVTHCYSMHGTACDRARRASALVEALARQNIRARMTVTATGFRVETPPMTAATLAALEAATGLRADAIEFHPEPPVHHEGFWFEFFGTRTDARAFTVYGPEGVVGRGELDLDPNTGAPGGVSLFTHAPITARDVRAAFARRPS